MIRALLCLVVAMAIMPADARIKRSQSAKVEFKYQHPWPATGARKGPCKGYIIDHVKPLSGSALEADVSVPLRHRPGGLRIAAPG